MEEENQEEIRRKVFANCRKCTRPYKKTAKFPDEDCPVCENTS